MSNAMISLLLAAGSAAYVYRYFRGRAAGGDLVKTATTAGAAGLFVFIVAITLLNTFL